MDTSQIVCALKSDPIARKRFCGVFPSDLLPKVLDTFPCGFVANTDPSNEPGKHWVVFYFQSEREGEFFDSYGKPPDYYHETFKEYVIGHSINWTFNSKQLQSILSDVCGHYCVFYLCHRARGHSMKAIVNMFDSNKISNDTKVFRFVNKHFRISPKIPGEKFSQSRKKLIEESRKL